MLEPVLLEVAVREEVALAERLVALRHHAPELDHLEQRRPLLDGQAVRREVGGAEADGFLEVGAPVLERLVRDAEDEVHGHVADLRDGGLDAGLGLRRVVRPVHEREVLVEERLDAERQARHAEVARGPEPRRAVVADEVFRVGLDRDLRQRGGVEVVVGRLEHAAEGVGREERGRPAAEVEGRQRGAVAELAAQDLGLGREGADVRALVPTRRREVEVAVDAALRAERDVDVEAGQSGRGSLRPNR